MGRKGDWFITYTGRQFWPLDVREEDVYVEDVARALSMVCRFGGHLSDFYSVAQHSVHVSRLVPPELALTGLMHDAQEAYLGDMVRPLKRMMPEYREAERRLWEVIAHKYRLPVELPSLVKTADNIAMMTERREFVNRGVMELPWEEDEKGVMADKEVLVPWTSRVAEEMFLERFGELWHE